MYEDRVVSNGYIKLLALNIGHLETEIIMERNTNNQNNEYLHKLSDSLQT